MLRVEQSHQSGESFPVGVTTVEYRFYDEVNNVAVCEFNVTVVAGLAEGRYIVFQIVVSSRFEPFPSGSVRYYNDIILCLDPIVASFS